MNLLFLGTGTFTTKRKCTSFVVDNNTPNKILFDIGHGVVDALIESGLENEIRYIIISHFHSDHIGDLMYFLTRKSADYFFRGKSSPLTIIAPVGAKEIFKKCFDAHFECNKDWMTSAEPFFNETIENVIELKHNGEFSDGEIVVKAFDVIHSPNSKGYIISVKDKVGEKTIGCSGDAEVCDGLLQNIKNADTWVLECKQNDENKQRFHMTFSEVSKIATENPDKKFFGVHYKDGVEERKDLPNNLHLPRDKEVVKI